VATRRRYTSRTKAVRDKKLKQAAALHHNRKLLTMSGSSKTDRQARMDRARNVTRRKAGRRKKTNPGTWAWVKDLDPTTWWQRKKGRRG
jgi:hypothetical protein